MEVETWISPRAQAERERLEKRLAFEVLFSMVDDGELDEASAIAMLRGLDPRVEM